MAVLNFPSSPSNGDNYVENGVTYTYTGTHPNGFWKADNQNYVTDIYMSTAGDTMTGNLLITPLGGGGNVALYADNNGQLRASAGSETLVSPFVDKAGSTMTGDLVFAGAQITSSGGKAKFGGTGTPDELLELYSTGSDVALELNYNDSKKAKIELTTGGDLEIRGTNGAIKFFRGNADGDSSTEIASFTTGGSLLVGTSTASSYADRLLTVGNTSHASPTIEIRSSTTGFAGLVFSDGVAADNSSYRGSLEYDHTNDLMQVRTAGNIVSTIDSSGNVGIADTSPNFKLDVNGDIGIREDNNLVFHDGAGTAAFRIRGDSSNKLHFERASNNAAQMIIDNGNVGIGTSSPGDYLASAHQLVISDAASTGITIATPTSSSGTIAFADGTGAGDNARGLIRYGHSDNSLQFSTNAAERMRIESDGTINMYGDAKIGNTSHPIRFATGSSTGVIEFPDTSDRSVIRTLGATPLEFEINSTPVGRFDSDGNFAIGVNTAPRKLSVMEGVYEEKIVRISGPDQASEYLSFGVESGVATIQAGGVGTFSNTLAFKTALSGVEAEGMRLDSNGRLLVGTSSAPTKTGNHPHYAKLVSVGNTAGAGDGRLAILRATTAAATSSGDVLGRITFGDLNGGDFATIECSANAAPADNDYPGRLSFYTTAGGSASGTERMRIGSDGSFTNFSDVNSVFRSARTGTTDSVFTIQTGSSNIGNGNTKFRVMGDGDVENTNNAYGAISDAKLKENIVDANSQWDDIKAIQFRNFNLKEETGHKTFTQLGVIAQELEEISPGLVTNTPDMDYVTRPKFDENGNPVVDENGNQETETTYEETGTYTKGVKYSVLYVKAMVALQEAMERIEALEVEVTALKNA